MVQIGTFGKNLNVQIVQPLPDRRPKAKFLLKSVYVYVPIIVPMSIGILRIFD